MLSTKCYDPDRNRSHWLYPRGNGRCKTIDHYENVFNADNIVFALQIPFPKEGVKDLDYTRWQQNLIGILQFTILFEKGNEVGEALYKLK